MERKNMVLLTVIAVATLLVAVVGATFAYFTATVTDERSGDENNGTTKLEAATIDSTTVVGQVSNGAGSFDESDIYPGHKEVAGMKVTVTSPTSGNAHIQVIWTGNNGFTDKKIKLTTYRNDSTDVDTSYMTCEKKTGTGTESDANATTFYEDCTTFNSGIATLGTFKKTVELSNGNVNEDSPVILVDETVTGEPETGKSYYYYVVAEYVNDTDASEESASQNVDFGATLTGQVTVRLAA